MNHFYVYMLKCNDNSYYIGHTDNLEKRLSEHNLQQYDNYTAKRLPVILVYYELTNTREEAFVAERKLKGWTRKKKEALIAGDWQKISALAKKKFNK